MARVAIFTDSASDLDPAEAAASGIHVIPLIVNFADSSFRAGVDMNGTEFWARMTAPDAPFPTTAASSPGDFRDAYESAFAEGAEAIVAVHVAETLSGAIKSARIARDMLPDREIHIVDSMSASMAIGLLARMGVELAEADVPAAEIANELEERAGDLRIYFALETLEYLKKGGRISGTQAAIGTLLSVKPVIMDAGWNGGWLLARPNKGWTKLDLGILHGSVSFDGKVVREGHSGDVLGHCYNALAWLANKLGDHGKRLRKGMIVSTGSMVACQFVPPGSTATGRIEGLGEVTLKYELPK